MIGRTKIGARKRRLSRGRQTMGDEAEQDKRRKKEEESKEAIQKRFITWIEEETLMEAKYLVLNEQKKKSKKVGIASQ